MKLGMKIRQLRTIKALTVSDLAKLLGVNVSVVSRWENGKIIPCMGNIKKIADALECDVELLTKCL